MEMSVYSHKANDRFRKDKISMFGLLVNYGMYSLRTQFLSWEYDIFPFLRIVDTGLWYFTVVGAFIIFLVGTRDIIKAK